MGIASRLAGRTAEGVARMGIASHLSEVVTGDEWLGNVNSLAGEIRLGNVVSHQRELTADVVGETATHHP